MKYKVGDYVIHNFSIFKIVYVNKIFKKYSLKSSPLDFYYMAFYGEKIFKRREAEVKGLISFNE